MNSEYCMIWGAGYCGGIALDAYGADMVVCFADSDDRNVGQVRWGKQIISYSEMISRAKSDNIRIVAASEDFGIEMEKALKKEGISNYDIFYSEYARDIVQDKASGISPLCKEYNDKVRPLIHPELECFKNIHKNKRIFLVGNGPSLKAEDLDILHKNNEICFGFNNIYSIFDQTKWRPDYYGVVDYYSYKIGRERMYRVPGKHFFWDIFSYFDKKDSDSNNCYFRYIRKGYSVNEMPGFSEDITEGLYLGYSSIYDIGLQVAAYMGASDIFLIGVDHNYPNKTGHEGNHFEGYYSESEKSEGKMVFYPIEKSSKGYESEKVERAFLKAELYSREHGFRIFNATRGGDLNVFERVDYDRLF